MLCYSESCWGSKYAELFQKLDISPFYLQMMIQTSRNWKFTFEYQGDFLYNHLFALDIQENFGENGKMSSGLTYKTQIFSFTS